MTNFPIDAALPQLKAALQNHTRLVLQAPPGAGKTTRVPLALLQETWLAGRSIVMLEPRRLAARMAAQFMAGQLGERVGETVGFRVRLDAQVSARTRLEVVTEGILTRRLQGDPELRGVGLVIFDEFHERSLHADLGLALCLETQSVLREDLRILVMSATLDATAIANLIGAPVIASEGRSFPVETRYIVPSARQTLEQSVPAAVRLALNEESGNILVFLPGAAEIGRVQNTLAPLASSELIVAPLYGNLTRTEQDQAVQAPPASIRKIVLATSIAETSLTIEGIRVVVDCGLSRVPRFAPTSGMTRLETVRVSQAGADQRRGRAGRLGPGVCYRLWSEGTPLAPYAKPEILETDLAPLALQLASWGVSDPESLRWLDPPPPAAYMQAYDLIDILGGIDKNSRITTHGKEMAALPVHPRLAHMMIKAKPLGLAYTACALAALLTERDVLKGRDRDPDFSPRLRLLTGDAQERAGGNVDGTSLRQIKNLTAQLARLIDADRTERSNLPSTVRPEPVEGHTRNSPKLLQPDRAGLLLAYAYPDRIAQRRPGGEARYRLANGRGARFTGPTHLANEEFIVAAELDGDAREAVIFRAAAISRAELKEHFAERIDTVEFTGWDSSEQAAVAHRRRRLGELVLDERRLENADPDKLAAAICTGIRELGIGSLPWTDELRDWRARARFLRRVEGDDSDLPDLSDSALAATLESWLAPFLADISRRAQFPRIDLAAALHALLSYAQQRRLDELAPTHIRVPSGSEIALDYATGGTPILAVRLQEMFGLADTPRIAKGRIPVILHLLSPARRPVQITQDLAGFWKNTYADVKKDLKGRYPKHYWPDDPLQAEALRGTRRPGA